MEQHVCLHSTTARGRHADTEQKAAGSTRWRRNGGQNDNASHDYTRNFRLGVRHETYRYINRSKRHHQQDHQEMPDRLGKQIMISYPLRAEIARGAFFFSDCSPTGFFSFLNNKSKFRAARGTTPMHGAMIRGLPQTPTARNTDKHTPRIDQAKCTSKGRHKTETQDTHSWKQSLDMKIKHWTCHSQDTLGNG